MFTSVIHKKHATYTSNIKCADLKHHLTSDPKFRKEIINILKTSKFQEYLFQCDKLNPNKYFTFTLIDYPALLKVSQNNTCDYNAFAEHFTNTCKVCAFPNIGKNAILISPNYKNNKNTNTNITNYKTIASYFRSASDNDLNRLLKVIGENVYEGCYLSTHGMGVNYLHVRIEKTPKYYVDV